MQASKKIKADKGTQAELLPRKAPTQERAKKTVELILDTTAKLLDEVGPDEFNTNLLAERAGIRVRTIYRYFPNKRAIATALANKWAHEEREWLKAELANFPEDNEAWLDAYERLVDGYISFAKKPGYLAIQRVMVTIPSLRPVGNQIMHETAMVLAEFLRKRLPRVEEVRINALATSLIATGSTLMDLTDWGSKQEDVELWNEMKTLHRCHIAHYINKS